MGLKIANNVPKILVGVCFAIFRPVTTIKTLQFLSCRGVSKL